MMYVVCVCVSVWYLPPRHPGTARTTPTGPSGPGCTCNTHTALEITRYNGTQNMRLVQLSQK